MRNNSFFLEYKKYRLYTGYWLPEKSRAAVLLVHGMGEHLERYTDYVIPKLLKSNIAVIAYDNFGHGKSTGKRGHCPDYKELLEVLDRMVSKSIEITEDIPVFLYGHSMGGNLVINYVLSYSLKVCGAIATSPFLRLAFQPPAWKLKIGKLLQKIVPSITLASELEVRALSRIPEEVEKYKNDPLVHDRISPNYTFPIMEAGERAVQNISKLSVPVLLVHGTGDRITDYKTTMELGRKSELTELELFNNGYHELHNDLEKERLLLVITNWILRNI